ncbi:MAG: metal ABC transporter permease [Dysgonamonadaceae bacterium]|jgi:zinc transport system permease protein|nr:metal ABC transporter permease [Dysgonamonadaceae bacterium]
MDLLHYTFFQNALLGSFFTCIACGIVGVYIVARRLVFISGGITHASFGGLGLGFYTGINPVISALIFSIASAFGVEWLSKRQGVREDSAIAAFWALGMALGVIFLYLTPGYTPNISAYLFGNILTITAADIWFAGILALLLTAAVLLFYPHILYTAFDREYAQTRGVNVSMIEHLMMLAIAVTVVASIRLVGIMLLMSLLTLPQMTAALFASRMSRMMLLSVLISFVGCVTGLMLSYLLNIPSGAAIIFVQVIVFFICKAPFALGICRRRR